MWRKEHYKGYGSSILNMDTINEDKLNQQEMGKKENRCFKENKRKK